MTDTTLPTKHKGALAELIACQWLLGQGYEVFRNISQHGIADLVALRDGELLKIDVKTASNTRSRPRLLSEQIKAGVAALCVFADGTCELDMTPLAGIRSDPLAVCEGCGTSFTRRKSTQTWCSKRCRETVTYREWKASVPPGTPLTVRGVDGRRRHSRIKPSTESADAVHDGE